jgi:hypothetical protein
VKKAVFWDVAPCRNGVNRRFGGTYRLHLQGRREIIRKPPREASVRDFRGTPFLHGATSQKTTFFIVTAVKTSNLLCVFTSLQTLWKFYMSFPFETWFICKEYTAAKEEIFITLSKVPLEKFLT